MSTVAHGDVREDAILRGRALVLGEHVNADLLHPPAFFSLDAARVRSGFLAGLGWNADPGTADGRWIVVAGRNFGCGSSRETTVDALRRGGVVALVAPSFGRIFERTATALGLPCFTTADTAALAAVAQHAEVAIDPSVPSLLGEAGGAQVVLDRPDPFLEGVRDAGGLLEWLEQRRP